MVYDRTLWDNLIHVANPTSWDKAWLLLLWESNCNMLIGVCNLCLGNQDQYSIIGGGVLFLVLNHYSLNILWIL
jgi:hypothetical protein